MRSVVLLLALTAAASSLAQTPPPPPPAASPEIPEDFVQPTLIGGMEALAQRVVYPEVARDAGVEGRVFVQFVVDETGAVIDPVAVRSPSEMLSEAAIDAVLASRFTPGSERGRPVKVRFMLPVNFTLTADMPAAADSSDAARVARIVEVYDVEATFEDFLEVSSGDVSEAEFRQTADASQSALAERLLEFDSARIARVHDYITGPDYAAVDSMLGSFLARIRTPEGEAEMVARLTDPTEKQLVPEKLARAFVEAVAPRDLTAAFYRNLITRAAEVDPGLIEASGGRTEWETGIEFGIAELLAGREDEVYGSRAMLFGMDRSTLDRHIAFSMSEDGLALFEASTHAAAEAAAGLVARMLRNVMRNVDEIEVYDVRDSPPSPTVKGEIYEVVENQPVLIGGIEGLMRRVEYPVVARDAGIQGRVFVEFVVDTEGRVRDPFVRRSPSDLLSEAALDAVLGSRFTPGTQRGVAVNVRFVLPINFVLN